MALQSAVGAELIVCPKVRIADILSVSSGPSWQAHMNRINQKHVDFLLCAAESIEPVAVIELDDRTHERDDRRASDRFKDDAFESVGLPLIRFPASWAYQPHVILERLKPLIEVERKSISYTYASVVGADVPTCPKCGIEMVLRTARQGEFVGQRFYGCKNFPHCRERQTMPD